MQFSEGLDKMMAAGVEDLFRNVAAMPEDKLTWKPAETSRSARELLNEILSATNYNIAVLKAHDPANAPYEDSSALELPELEKQIRAAAKEFVSVVATYSDEQLADEVVLPWGTMTFFDSISYTYWNLMYHIGQIAYIQTLYGDAEFH